MTTKELGQLMTIISEELEVPLLAAQKGAAVDKNDEREGALALIGQIEVQRLTLERGALDIGHVQKLALDAADINSFHGVLLRRIRFDALDNVHSKFLLLCLDWMRTV